ncbi:MAG: hypothetical protein HXX09_04110 [Bacteroidetes bacterium]|nr:hypothetical protein [Bacteroidota bacterium]
MKKFTPIFIAVSLFLLLFQSSCKQCSTCSAKDKTNGSELNSQEFCGESADVKANEDSYKSTWGTSADVTCSPS